MYQWGDISIMPFLPFIPFADCAEVVMQFVQQSVPWFLTFGVSSTDPLTPTKLQEIWDVFDAWWSSDLDTNVSTNCTLTAIKATDLTTQFSPVILGTPTGTATGALSGSVLPAQVAIVTSFGTANRGRSYRGRSYLAGRVFTDQDTVTQWGSARVSAVETAYTNLEIALNAESCQLAVLSRQENGVRRTVGVATPITTITTKSQIATQRRRLI